MRDTPPRKPGRPLTTPPDKIAALIDAKARDPEASAARLGREVGIADPQKARDLLTRFTPQAETLGAVLREDLIVVNQQIALKAASRADELLDQGGMVVVEGANGTTRMVAGAIGKEVQALMTASAIAQDKMYLAAGQPTVIGYIGHDVRVQLPDLLEKLLRVGREALPPGAEPPAPPDPSAPGR